MSALTFLALAGLLFGCSSNQYNRTYRKVWKQVVNSPEWQASLALQSRKDEAVQYASNEDLSSMANEIPMDKEFIERYHRLVSRAYFKIIAEAEKVDQQIRETYHQLRTEDGPSDELALAEKRYKAHTTMLEGLKSWNAFSDNATADIEFFKAEHIVKSHEMLQKGISDQEVVRYLMLELADLYHVEEMLLRE